MTQEHNSRWLAGKTGTEFLQFARGRITRSPSPLGGYLYTTSENGQEFYSGNSYEAAHDALDKVDAAELRA